MEWQPIETAPKDGREMFVVRAFDVDPNGRGIQKYTTDAYCVWREGDKFARWPHNFPPTHWVALPKKPQGA